jgi:protein gp37
MAEVSKIEWTDATFNPWIGCTKISPACDHCYAEDWANRYQFVTWGGDRRRTSAATWRQPVKLNAQAIAEGRRIRVFCASLADVFDNQVPPEWRADLWALIRATPALDWLLLTKRPQNIVGMLPEDWAEGYPNVALGTTVEDQVRADQRIPALLAAPAVRRFLSCEPLLGPIKISLGTVHHHPDNDQGNPAVQAIVRAARRSLGPTIDWVITGGESGAQARPSHPDWFRSLRDQCAAAGVPFLFKQWGEWVPLSGADGFWPHNTPKACRIMPSGERHPRGKSMQRVGKARAGRLLDGVLHNGFPS